MLCRCEFQCDSFSLLLLSAIWVFIMIAQTERMYARESALGIKSYKRNMHIKKVYFSHFLSFCVK